MDFLITGATGFLGRHLLQCLQDHVPQAHCYVLVRNIEAWNSLAWTQNLPQVTPIVGSIVSHHQAPLTLAQYPMLNHVQGIFHLAALVRHSRQQANELIHINVEGTKNVIALAGELGCRVVYVSTSGTVGCSIDPKDSANEHSPFCESVVQHWPYYASKIIAEQQAQQLAKALRVSLVVMRPPIMLGPQDHRLRSSSHILRFLRKQLPFLLHGGMHYVDIRDVSMALVKAMQHPQPQPVYHLPGTMCSIAEFFNQLSEITGMRAPRVVLPNVLARILANLDRWHVLPDPVVIEMAAHYWNIHSLYAWQDLGFAPRPGAQTLQDTVAWLQQENFILTEA